MSYLVDTNFLLRLAQNTSPFHSDARNAYSTLRTQGELLTIVPQNLVEFWAVATRPSSVNGLGLLIAVAAQELSEWRAYLRCCLILQIS